MDAIQSRGMGWLPDVPSIKDYTEDAPEVAPLVARTSLSGLRSPDALSTAPSKAGGASRGQAVAVAPALATAVDLRAYFSSIEDQGALGSCTANAAVGLVEYFERRAHGKYIDASRLFVYKATRNLLGWTGDTGAYIRTTMGALVLFGAPPERYLPYDIAKFDLEPSSFCYAFGASYQAIKYLRLDRAGITPVKLLQDVKRYLAAGFPSMFGFPVYDEFYAAERSKEVAFPAPSSKLYGGHAIVAAGYDDNRTIGGDKGALLIRNSWGPGWGDQGYAWMSYRYVTEELAEDFWTLIKGEWVDTGNF